MSERILTVAPAALSAPGTFSVPRHSSMKNTRSSGGVEVEFDADRFFDFFNFPLEVIREIRHRFTRLEPLCDFNGGDARTADNRPPECDFGIDGDYLWFISHLLQSD